MTAPDLSPAEAAVVARFDEAVAAPESCRPLRAGLEELDAAHLQCAPRPWRVGQHYGIHLYAGDQPVGTTQHSADAALIVAAVNALPELIARLRAVLDLADEHDRRADLDADPDCLDARINRMAADRIRAAAEGATR